MYKTENSYYVYSFRQTPSLWSLFIQTKENKNELQEMFSFD